MPMIDVGHDGHEQRSASLPTAEPGRLVRDPDSDDAGMPRPTFAAGKSDRWASGREALRTADPRMAELIDTDPGLNPDALFDGWPSDLWGALVLQVIGQQLSRAAAGAILGRLEALHGNRRRRVARIGRRLAVRGLSPLLRLRPSQARCRALPDGLYGDLLGARSARHEVLVAAATSRRAFSSAHQTSILRSGSLRSQRVEEHRLGGGFDAHAVLEVAAGRLDQRLRYVAAVHEGIEVAPLEGQVPRLREP
jgi:hypothetical protein